MENDIRKGSITRNTSETKVNLEFVVDGSGTEINTGIAFFDHMLNLFTKHGLFDLRLDVKGDFEVDFHHTVEDVGICLDKFLKKH